MLNLVYIDKPASIDALEDNIEAFIHEICWKKYAKKTDGPFEAQ